MEWKDSITRRLVVGMGKRSYIVTIRHLDRDAAVVTYREDLHEFSQVLSVLSPADCPIEALDTHGRVTLRGLNSWWNNRSIPSSRDGARRLFRLLDVDSPSELLERSLGLSLSDAFWVVPDEMQDATWESVNFFENDFPDELGLRTAGIEGSTPSRQATWGPSGSVGGDLPKAWIIGDDGKRILLKGGRGVTAQEPWNELIATKLYERVFSEGSFVPYHLVRRRGQTFSACNDFISTGQDFVPAYAAVFNQKKRASINNYEWCVSSLERSGVEDVEAFICAMICCDFVLGNFDRHYGNFGLVRDASTLEFVGMAPIFDSGNSLWCNRQTLSPFADHVSYAYDPLPFAARGEVGGHAPDQTRQLRMLRDFEWYEQTAFDLAPEIVHDVLSQNENFPPRRIDLITRAVKHNVSVLGREAALGLKRAHCGEHLKSIGYRQKPSPWELAQRSETEGCLTLCDNER